MSRAVVLGAGIQGVCVALALRESGWDVVLVDREREPMLTTSLRNEGKIHLGYVYANDRSFRTSQLMIDAAMAFAPLLERWAGQIDWSALRSRPFDYLVMRDSMLDVDAIAAHFERVDAALGGHGSAGVYLGEHFGTLHRRMPLPVYLAAGVVGAVFRTPEVAIDLERFRAWMLAALERSGIDVRCGHRVDAAAPSARGFVVSGQRAGSDAWEQEGDLVVNCLWGGRLPIDAQMGMVPVHPWVHRLKYRVLAALPPSLQDLPSITMVLGPYGDIVPIPGASYLSWYPECRAGWSAELSPPAAWAAACRGEVGDVVSADVARRTLQALDRIVPGIAAAQVARVDAGLVFSWGRTDIDLPDSQLHERYEVGLHGGDGYWSIDTGKLGCAPYFAQQLLDLL